MALYELESALNAAIAAARGLGPNAGGPRLLVYLQEAQQIAMAGSILVPPKINGAAADFAAAPSSSSALLTSLQASVLSLFLQVMALIQLVLKHLVPGEGTAAVRGKKQQLQSASPVDPRQRAGGHHGYDWSSAASNSSAARPYAINIHSPTHQQPYQASVRSSSNLLSDVESTADAVSVTPHRRLVYATQRHGETSSTQPDTASAAAKGGLLGCLGPQALVDFVGSAVQLMGRVAAASARAIADRNARLRQSTSCSAVTGGVQSLIDPTLELLRAVFQNEDNCRLWARHFGLRCFSASTMDFSDKLILETNHVSEQSSGARGKVIADLVLNVLDLNEDGAIDVVELAMALPAKSVITAVEEHVYRLVSTSSPSPVPPVHSEWGWIGPDGGHCERCRLVEAELAVARREIARVTGKLREARLLTKASRSRVT